MSTDPRLEVSGLEKRFAGGFTVSVRDLEVGDDEIVALLGPSGCGKTTVLRCVAGVESPDEGEITIDGQRVYGDGVSKPPEKRHLGMVYQNYAIWPHKTVYETVEFPLRHASHSIPRDEFEARVETVLEMVEIPTLRDTPATDLSGGQQQRTALARALVHDPDLLLMDEPLSNLDKDLRKKMRYELQRLHHDLGFSMLYVTHDQEEAFYLADRVLVMKDGRIVEEGTPAQLYHQPVSPFTRSFVGVQNRVGGSVGGTPAGESVVRTDIGDFPLSAVGHVSEAVTSGEGVYCFIRPRDISIGRFAPREDTILELEGTVTAAGMLGERYEISVVLQESDTELTLQTEINREYERGDEIQAYIEPRAIQVYPATDV